SRSNPWERPLFESEIVKAVPHNDSSTFRERGHESDLLGSAAQAVKDLVVQRHRLTRNGRPSAPRGKLFSRCAQLVAKRGIVREIVDRVGEGTRLAGRNRQEVLAR